MKHAKAISLAILVAAGLFLGGCGAGDQEAVGTFLVTVRGLLADASSHAPVTDAIVTVGSEPAALSGSDGWFTVPDVQAAANLSFQALHPDYQTVQGVLTLDGTARTWSLLIAGGPEKQGTLLEDSPGHLSFPGPGQAYALVVDMTAIDGGNGGDDMPPGLPPGWGD